MNNETRKKIREIYTQIEGFTQTDVMKEVDASISAALLAMERLTDSLEKASDEVSDLITAVCDLQESEQEKFDNMSEGLQQGETGQAIEAAAEALSRAAGALEEIQSELDDETDIGGMWGRMCTCIQPTLDALDEAAQ